MVAKCVLLLVGGGASWLLLLACCCGGSWQSPSWLCCGLVFAGAGLLWMPSLGMGDLVVVVAAVAVVALRRWLIALLCLASVFVVSVALPAA